MNNILVSTQWLSEHIDDENLILLDASMSKVIGKEPIEYANPTFIPNSQKLCLETVFCDTTSDSVHAFPTAEQFKQGSKTLGIRDDSLVVIYDNQGIYSSPRAWWIFQAMGFRNAYILDGGLPKWIAEGRGTVDACVTVPVAFEEVNAAMNTHLVCDWRYVRDSINSDEVCVLDARSEARFLGEAPEPRAGVRSGHIPHSVNVPFGLLLDSTGFKDADALSEVFASRIYGEPSQLVFSCGSGVTACIVLVAARLAGYTNTVLYDGSWSEWGSDHSLPIE